MLYILSEEQGSCCVNSSYFLFNSIDRPLSFPLPVFGLPFPLLLWTTSLIFFSQTPFLSLACNLRLLLFSFWVHLPMTYSWFLEAIILYLGYILYLGAAPIELRGTSFWIATRLFPLHWISLGSKEHCQWQPGARVVHPMTIHKSFILFPGSVLLSPPQATVH